jgi:hypothetical protein
MQPSKFPLPFWKLAFSYQEYPHPSNFLVKDFSYSAKKGCGLSLCPQQTNTLTIHIKVMEGWLLYTKE